MQKSLACVLAATVAGIFVAGLASAAESPEKERAELAKALAAAKVSLGSGLTAATAVGKPISAKFEAEDGKLQLSVYTEKGGKFNEVVVDHATGKVAKSEAIAAGEDLTHAKSQSEAMAGSGAPQGSGVADGDGETGLARPEEGADEPLVKWGD